MNLSKTILPVAVAILSLSTAAKAQFTFAT